MIELPVELWTPILQQVHRHSRDDLLTCMQLNQAFFEISFPILYRNVSLKLRDAFRFKRSVLHYAKQSDSSELEGQFPYTRCLRLVIPGDGREYGYGGLRTPSSYGDRFGADIVAERGIEALVEVLGYLSKLRTLSIVTYSGHRLNTWDAQGLGPPVSGEIMSASSARQRGPDTNTVAALVAALPETVRDLSIDLSELSRYEPKPRCGLCPAINSKVPQLEHLNMHLRSYCPSLLLPEDTAVSVYTSLKSVIMRIHGFSARLCSKTSLTGILNLDTYTRCIKSSMHHGLFPNIEQFNIISKRRQLGARGHSDAKWTIYVRGLVEDQTAAIPRIFIDSRTPDPGNTFVVSARTMVRLPSNCTFIKPIYWDKEYVGKSGSIRRFVEGRAGWRSFVHGPHIPGLRRADIDAAVAEGYYLRSPPPSLAVEFREKNEKTCQLWQDEAEAGMKLLEPAVWNGVLDNQVIQRIEP